jgi:FkbM family methyltransferase
MEINNNLKILTEIVSNNLLINEPFFLYDVGARGGIEQYWFNYGEHFKSIGFDPDPNEVIRLNENKSSNLVDYYDLTIRDVKSEYHSLYGRFSSVIANNIVNKIPSNTENKTISIDNFTKKYNINNVDFIKIDTDGYDLEVIRSASEILKNSNVLGLMVECQFHGSVEDRDNKFSKINDALEDFGFSVFDMNIWKYSRSCLPSKFLYNIFGQTENGQIAFADVLFLKDYSRKNYSDEWGELSLTKQLKLVSLFELFNLFDCAAELLLQIKSKNIFDNQTIDGWLDYLAKCSDPTVGSYSELINNFNSNPSSFFKK